MPAPGSRYVFVYGTLRRGQVNDITRLRPAPRLIGMASVPGVLYDLGAYPGLVPSGGGPVRGEVYAIDPILESRLDAIEEMPGPRDDPATGEYLRREIDVRVAGRMLRCLVYAINPARLDAGARVIVSGDWCRRDPPSVRSAEI